MTNIALELASAAAEAPERPAVKLDDHTLSYGTLDRAIARAAVLLRAEGVRIGDRLGIQLPNVPYFPIVYYAVLRLGAVAVPMNPLLKAGEIAYHLADSGARLMVGWHGFEDEARAGSDQAGVECLLIEPGAFEVLLGQAVPVDDVVDRGDDDPAVIIYTSGTTGTPKGATLTHANLRAGAEVARDLVDAGPESVAVATLPLFHVFGMNSIMNTTFLARGLMTLVPRFEPTKVLEVIERDRATTFAGVPTMYAALLNHPERSRYDVSALELCVSGGSAMPVEVLRGFDEAFGAKILEGYGLSETTGMASFNLRDRKRKPGSIGVPVGGTEMRVVDDHDGEVGQGEPGEIVLRGPFVMAGYWGRPDATAEVMAGGWFHTGDIATVDSDGYFFIVDRKKDLIIRGGYNVYPREIEEVLYTHPAVLEAAVVGVPHESLGEEVGAAVVLKAGEQPTPDELRDHVRSKVAAYKYPRVVWLMGELPKGPTGKILKREITPPNPDPPHTPTREKRSMQQLDSTQFDMSQLDITKQNVAVEKVLDHTTYPRHRYLLQAYLRHRYLESAGRWEEILDPALTVEHPYYRFSLRGRPPFTLDGRDQVAAVYGHWTQTDQCVFYVEDESVAVGDHMVVGRGIGYQQTLGSELAGTGLDVDQNSMYLMKSQIMMLWPYDDQCRLLGEDVWEFDDTEKALIKLDPADVLTAEQAGKLLDPFIKPLPPFDDSMLPS